MDFIEGITKSYGKVIIMVVVDQLSKYAHSFPLVHPYKAINVAQIFIDNIFKLHGMPSTVISDCAQAFTKKLWNFFFFKIQGTTLNMSSAYHP